MYPVEVKKKILLDPAIVVGMKEELRTRARRSKVKKTSFISLGSQETDQAEYMYVENVLGKGR